MVLISRELRDDCSCQLGAAKARCKFDYPDHCGLRHASCGLYDIRSFITVEFAVERFDSRLSEAAIFVAMGFLASVYIWSESHAAGRIRRLGDDRRDIDPEDLQVQLFFRSKPAFLSSLQLLSRSDMPD